MWCDDPTERCKSTWTVRAFRCTDSYEWYTAETGTYGPSWLPVANLTGYSGDALTPLEQSFVYQTDWQLHGDYYDGQIAYYSGGGYVADLGDTLASASAMIVGLRNAAWIDQYTRAVFVEFATWNPSSTLFNTATVLFEYPTNGDTIWSMRMEVLQLYRYSAPGGQVALLVEIICAICVLVATIIEVRRMFRGDHRYFKEIWNLLQLASLALFYVAVGLYAARCMWTVWSVDDMMNNPGKRSLCVCVCVCACVRACVRGCVYCVYVCIEIKQNNCVIKR